MPKPLKDIDSTKEGRGGKGADKKTKTDAAATAEPDEAQVSLETAETGGSINRLTIEGQDYVLTFNDEFNGSTVSFWAGHGRGGIWSTSFSPHLDDLRYIEANGELQYYVDPDMDAFPDAFSLGGGSLTLTASALDAEQQQLAEGQPYSSGMIATEMSFATTSGYFEMGADVPAQTGLWSAFWLLPEDGDWSAEIDVFEVLGESADTLHTNLWAEGSPDAQYVTQTGAGEGFHTYGLYWDETVIRWYYDGALIRESENTVDEAMYLVCNLAVGGWAADPDATTDLTDGLSIDYVRVYELESSTSRNEAIEGGQFKSTKEKGGSDEAEVTYGSRWGDIIDAQAGDDTVYGKDGDDVISGGAGADKLFGQTGSDSLSGGAGTDHLVGGAGADRLAGGAGTDHLWGGSYGADGAADVFVFGAGSGKDYVHDYEAGLDRLDFGNLSGQVDLIMANSSDQGWAVKIDLAAAGGEAGDVIYLKDVALEDLTAADFGAGLFV
ncbi:family 16 glycosylhydrolase [Pseudoroseicyclus aestuarii]|uniref:Hemolysin type calcium-binding protein n=1 Tax=Pseudoroseicyclus aestuarii TaxID=1795041 RepID=A0A318SU39_9RHOB|nr:family 16 glycosylhydrolase [Pseudoroseicyclus aestuarii]PYE83756.1 hemolysin type calcium-binding protein [Pseudoroseicyclus aestuarii]